MEDEEDQQQAQDHEVKSPIVFQCASCKQIVGDSLSLISADEELRHLTLQGACGVVRSPQMRTSEEGKDLGSTYHELFCGGCNIQLGKVYLTTAPHLDTIRNLFTFNTDALDSYELGRYDHTCEGPTTPAGNRAAAAGGGGGSTPPIGPRGEVVPSISHAEGQSIMMELTKLQNMMLVFHDRISRLERVHIGGASSTSFTFDPSSQLHQKKKRK